ncbi:sensor histidine kinase [Nonomuraea sp. ZG12]|uniref:sensor histidine kinase n=1 Tax=Nonomuraea sp. ZG12 TaxID=3452207 RepID=UPI003F8B12F8
MRSSVPAALGALVFVTCLMAVTGGQGFTPAPPAALVPVAAAAAGVAAWQAGRSWWPLALVAAVVYPSLVMWPPLVVASYYVGTSWRRTRDLVAYLVVAALTMTASVVVGRLTGGIRETVTATPANATLMAAGTVGLPLVFGLWIRTKREVLAAARERADRLEREQVMRAEQARTQERARIAREMHDVVAHRVSLMVLHAGALEVRSRDEEAAGTAAMIGDIGREALTNLREILGVLRSPHQPVPLSPQPTLGDLDRLLDQTRSLGISVVRHDHGQARPLGATVERTAYRVVQEALTNVHKHAADARTDVHLRFLAGELQVEIHNLPPRGADLPSPGADVSRRGAGPSAGGGAPAAAGSLPGSGWGLAGLRERVELLGGTLQAGPRADGGFGVLATIPAEAAA